MATIYDIAKITGFAPSTVSKALNNYKGVSEKTRELVNNAVEQLKYIPNINARSLMTRKSHLIGVLVRGDDRIGMLHPHFSEILENFRLRMAKYGYDLIFMNNKIGNDNISYLEHYQYRGLDGVIIAIGNESLEELKEISELIDSGAPAVSVEGIYNNAYSVLSDNHQGTYEALSYLYLLGHKNIAIVRVSGNSLASELREEAFRNFMEENNLPFSEKNIIKASEYDYESGVEAANILIKNGIQNLPTAVVCVSDDIAVGLIENLKQYDIIVPENISVIGFDDVPIAKYVGLTTIRQKRKQIGEIAADSLFELINNDNIISKNIILDTELVIRNTCKRISQN